MGEPKDDAQELVQDEGNINMVLVGKKKMWAPVGWSKTEGQCDDGARQALSSERVSAGSYVCVSN